MIDAPSIAEALVDRPALVARLSAALDRGGLLLTAGAGYGKTTALAQTLATRTGPTAWVSCATTGDGEAALLLQALVERLREVTPGSSDVLAGRLQDMPQRVDVPALTLALRTDLEKLLVEPVVVVIDDAERIEGSPEALALVEVLLGADPRALRLAVASRRPLAVRTSRLAAAGRATEIGAGELAFTTQECAEVLRRRRGRPPTADEADALLTGTEGWPLGVALSAAAPGHPGTSPTLGGDAVFAYLDQEVLSTLDGDLRRGVLDAAVAPELTAPMLAALGLPADFPDRAQRAGLVLRPLDQGSRWSFHPLLREFLLARLEAERSEAELARLHALVAGVLAGAGRRREAVDHWLDAGEWREALTVAVGLGPDVQRMSPSRVRGWLDRLPEEAWEDPDPHLVLGQLEWGLGHHERAIPSLREAVAGYDTRDQLLSAWLARSILCDALFSTGGFDEIERLAEGWDAPGLAPLGSLPKGVAWYSAFVRMSRGRAEEAEPLLALLRGDAALGPLMHHFDRLFTAYAEASRGQVDVALDMVAESADQLAQHDPGNHAPFVAATRGFMQMDVGRYAEAMDTWAGLADASAQAGVAFLVSTSRWERAWLYAEAGSLDEAELELRRGGSPLGSGRSDGSFDKACAAIALLRDEPEEAVAACERTLELVRPLALFFRYYTVCHVVPILVAAGAPALARAALEETLSAYDEAFAGDRGRWPRSRLLAMRAWLRSLDGAGTPAIDDDLRRSWADARGCEHHLLRAEWARIEPLLHHALARGVLDADAVIGALQRAFPGGRALAGFVEHPLPEVRRAALPAAVASGHPDTPARIDRLAGDPDPGIAAAAVAARSELDRHPPALKFTLLGTFTVKRATWTLDEAAWERPLAARLVRFLLVHREASTPEDELFEAFWPGKDASAARRNLAVAMSLARKAVDLPGARDSIIHTDGRAHQLRLRSGDQLDTQTFEAAAAAALTARGGDALPLLEHAEGLWTGEPLPEERYAEWTFAWRERLTDRYTHVLTALTEGYTLAGRAEDALRVARTRVELDPLNESAQRALIVGYSRAGRRDHALRQFLSCRRALVEDLGIEPSEATRRLQEQVLAGTPV
ncbi:MAG TPA: BTAD domain-containing putative transcriptional regulator [Thermoleophilaceae bacterium]|nr:BTAD domain-containing putative transcriptional regulator [Thermoleophilaceae bacterium]